MQTGSDIKLDENLRTHAVFQQVDIMPVATEMLLTWIEINHSRFIVMEMGDVGVPV
jgi:hypothetical protein